MKGEKSKFQSPSVNIEAPSNFDAQANNNYWRCQTDGAMVGHYAT
jgi:hypothetical protein